jgi:glutathionyl-hydroquinone reductase
MRSMSWCKAINIDVYKCGFAKQKGPYDEESIDYSWLLGNKIGCASYV